MNMREAFVKTTNELIEEDPRVALVLGGISVASFTQSLEKYPQRAFDAGIMEQGDISIAAGMAITGMIPIFHTIAPFLAERAFEQLKIDFGYQNLPGNFISNGSSIDYSSFGATHQCPAEIGTVKQIPNMQVVVAGTATEFEQLYRQCYDNGSPTYYRLSRDQNGTENDVSFGKATVIRRGTKATILAVGPMLDIAMRATADMDVSLLYYTTLAPFDGETLAQNCNNGKLLICEPYYSGALLYDIHQSLEGRALYIESVGMPHEFCQHYGSTVENMAAMGITEQDIQTKLKNLIEQA